MEPPSILRIKRKRGQDPLQALVLEDKQAAKRSKPSSPVSSGVVTPNEKDPQANFYFKLARTDDLAPDDISALNSILNEAKNDEGNEKSGERNFVIPKPQTQEDMVIPNELSDMVNSFVLSDSQNKPQRKRRNHSTLQEPEKSSSTPVEALNDSTAQDVEPGTKSGEIDGGKDSETDEYVYDVYHLSSTAITNQNHPKSQIGYIKFFNEEDEEFNGSEASNDRPIYSDNEDSNAEDYYQNDYPEDEDADIEDDVHNDYKDTELENDDINDLFDYVQQNNMTLVDAGYESAEDADYVYGEDDDFDEDDDDYDMDDDIDDYDNEGFQRQTFFENESEDELAIHRDKIFSKLQRMVDEA